MTAVDLNADLAEGETLTASDREVLAVVTSASLACGFHAGNRAVMQAAAAVCVDRGVTIGAHVSFRDREGFGRRALGTDPFEARDDMVEQITVLAEVVAAEGGRLSYVKPHGALYHQMGVDPPMAAAVVDAVTSSGIGVLMAQAASAVARPAVEGGLSLVPEGFPDRGYRPDGRLVARSEPGALVDDPAVVGRRAVSLVVHGGVESVDGSWTPVEVESLCVHGDAPDAAGTARAVRDALEAGGVVVRTFVAEPPAGSARGAGR